MKIITLTIGLFLTQMLNAQIKVQNLIASFDKPKEVALSWTSDPACEYQVYRNTLNKIGGFTEKLLQDEKTWLKKGYCSDIDDFNRSITEYYYYLKIRQIADKKVLGFSQIVKGAPFPTASIGGSGFGGGGYDGGFSIVGMVPFTSSRFADSIVARNVSELVTTTLIKTRRFRVLELDKWDLIRLEQERQKGELFLEKEIIEQGRALGVDALIVGKVINAEVYNKDGIYASQVDFTLRRIDVRTGQSKDARDFKGVYSSNGGKLSTAQLAVAAPPKPKPDSLRMDAESYKAINGVLSDAVRDATQNGVGRWIGKTFKYRLQLLKAEKDDKNIDIIIEGGEDLNMRKGDKFRIVIIERLGTIKPIDYERLIAHIEVTELASESATCKIVKPSSVQDPLGKKYKELQERLRNLSKEELARCVVLFD